MNWLIAAYGVMWLIIFGYILNIYRRQQKLQDEVTRLQKMLDSQKKS